MARGARNGDRSTRRYSRMARVDELCREIVADELERLDDPRLELVTVTHVAVDADLRRAIVEFTDLDADDDTVLEALGEHRKRLQAAIGSQARLKHTPELQFRPDETVRTAVRLEEILKTVKTDEDS